MHESPPYITYVDIVKAMINMDTWVNMGFYFLECVYLSCTMRCPANANQAVCYRLKVSMWLHVGCPDNEPTGSYMCTCMRCISMDVYRYPRPREIRSTQQPVASTGAAIEGYLHDIELTPLANCTWQNIVLYFTAVRYGHGRIKSLVHMAAAFASGSGAYLLVLEMEYLWLLA